MRKPNVDSIKKIISNKKILMGAGPVPIPKEVEEANRHVINHLGDQMSFVTNNIQEMGKYIMQTNTDRIFAISGPSSAAMEMSISNLLWTGRNVLCLEHGIFGSRFTEMAKKVNANVDTISSYGKIITPDEVEEKFKKNKYDVITMVQGETSCGLKNIYIKEISKIAKKYNTLVIVDAICTLSTMELPMDDWKIDVVVSGGQKGLSSISGVSIIAFSENAWNVIENRDSNIHQWCYDAIKANEFWNNNSYHYTAPVSGLLALHEAMRLICEEGLEFRFKRHLKMSKLMQKELENMGFELYMEEKYRLNSVIAVSSLKKIDSIELLNFLDNKYNIQLSGSFGLPIFRIGQMGEQARIHMIKRTLHALKEFMNKKR